MEKRVKPITICLAGGASLGAYEAGVLRELLYALEQHNQRSDAERFVIDVVCGASAGSINIGLLARVLYGDFERYKGLFHECWVKKASIEALSEEDSDNSIFSNAFLLDTIGNALRKTAKEKASEVVCPSARPARLYCGILATNQVGIDYGSEHFIHTQFSEGHEFEIDEAQFEDPAYIEKFIKHIAASGSFPLAFPPIFLDRHQKDYKDALGISVNFLPKQMGYVDGGLFRNEPLDIAVKLSLKADGGILSPERTFLFIDPSRNASGQKREYCEKNSLFSNALRLIGLIFQKATKDGWKKAEGKNVRINLFNNTLASFPKQIARMDESAYVQTLKEYQELVQEFAGDRAMQHVRERYAELFSQLSPERAPLLLSMIIVHSAASGLEDRYPLRLREIISHSDLTAGDPIAGFGGFFHEVLREYDFRMGRKDAHKQLSGLLGVKSYAREGNQEGHNPLYEPEPMWGDLSSVTVDMLSVNKRVRFAKRLMEKVESILRAEPANLRGLKLTIAKHLIRKVLYKRLKISR